MISIRLDRKTKTIKVVNRRETIKLSNPESKVSLKHTGKTGPIGPQGLRGETGGYYVSYILSAVPDVAPDQGKFALFSPNYMVFNRVDQRATDLFDYFNSLANTGVLEIFVLDDVAKFSICDYEKPIWFEAWGVATGALALENGSVYRALQDHTTTLDDQPEIGVNWTDFWELVLPSAMVVSFNQTATSYSFQGNEAVGITFISDGEIGPQGPTGESTFVRVHHGSDPNVPRPSALYVEWVGSVAPNNATVEDTWIDTA